MVTLRRLRAGAVLLLLGSAIVGCGAPENDEEAPRQPRSALTASLFEPYVAYATGSWAEAVAIGDLDDDGRNDIALVTSSRFDPDNDNTVHVFLQAVDGSLQPRVKYPVGAQSRSIDIGDVNGDGHADVVVGLASSQIGVLRQNALGTLDPVVTYPTMNSYRVKVGDFNGDGRMDIAGINTASYSGEGGPDIFLQDESGALASPVNYRVIRGGTRAMLDAGDINGDGRTDLVVMSGSPDVSVLLQTPEGVLGAPAPYSLPGTANASGLAIGDTSGDGRTDIVVSYGGNRPNSFIARFLQDATGAMEPPASYASYDIPSAIRIADVDGDGRKDVLVIHDGWSQLGVYRQSSSGGFGSEELYAIPDASNYEPQGLAVGDINGDGWPDAVIADYNSGLVVLHHEVSPSLTVTGPVSDQFVGATATIAWTHNLPAGDNVRIEVSRDGGGTFELLAASAPTTGSFNWIVTGPPTSLAMMRVTSNAHPSATGTSPTFAIQTPTIIVTEPAAGATVVTPMLSISWTHNLGPAALFRIELSRDGGATFETLADSVGSFSTYYTYVFGPGTTQALIRITSTGAVTATGTSGAFTLFVPTVTITEPVAGTTLYAGTPVVITWSSNLPASSPVNVELTRNNGSWFEPIALNVPNTGSVPWVVTGPPAGAARVRVTAGTGALSASTSTGTFAIVTPEVTVTSPAAGTTLYPGTPVAISWSTNLPASLPVDIALSRDAGATFEPIAAAVPNTGSFAWKVTGPDAALAVVLVTVSGPVPASNASGPFAITTPALIVTGPPPGALVHAGTPVTITWTDSLPAGDPVSIEVSRDGGATFEAIAAAVPNTGSFVWTATGPDATEARVRVTSIGALPASGVGAAFQIVVPAVTVNSPAADESWAIGTVRTISWSGSNLPAGDTVRVELSRDGGESWTTMAAAEPSSGSLSWTATAPATMVALVRVVANGSVPAIGTSGIFAIGTPTVAVTSPAAGASWTIGSTQTITWATNLLPSATVRIRLSRDGGSTFTTLASEAPNTGSFTWKAAGAATATAMVRVVAIGWGVTATSDTFTLAAGKVTVTSPNTAVTWTIGATQTVTWTHNAGAGAQFKVEVSRSGTWSVITSAAPAGETSGSYDWTVVGPKTANAKVRVTWTSNTGAKDTSDVSFRIN